MSFTGFSEEDLKRIKSNTGETVINNDSNKQLEQTYLKKINKIGVKPQRSNQYKFPVLQRQSSDEFFDEIEFDKCKLSIRTPTSPKINTTDTNKYVNEDLIEKDNNYNHNNELIIQPVSDENLETSKESIKSTENLTNGSEMNSDVVNSTDDYNIEEELSSPRGNLEELQMKQKIMEEQNKKRKEMLAKALADRTKQTEEEVMRLEKIKKELQILDGQFSQDVGVLRKRIDQACWTFAEAEKHYLKVEKEFLQAKINLQKERERKELLTEHLCALITHNETRKAQKLETLMLELANDRKGSIGELKNDGNVITPEVNLPPIEVTSTVHDDELVIDGVEERTGKIVEISNSS